MKLLVVDDHPKIRENIVSYFSMQKIRVDEARTGEEALEKAPHGTYDVIILDVNMPMMGGKEFLEKFRKDGFATPVIALTSNSLLADKEELYEAGVDDYLTKPFELKELFLRVQAIARRKEQTLSEVVRVGSIEIDTVHMQVKKDGKIVDLSAKEIGILNYLACNLGIPRNKTDIILHVW